MAVHEIAGYWSSSAVERPPKGFRRSPFFGAADGGRPAFDAFPPLRPPAGALAPAFDVRRVRPALPPFTAHLHVL